MNYFTLNPHFSMPVQQSPQNLFTRSSMPIPLVIRAIAGALKTSITNYQNAMQNKSTQSDIIVSPQGSKKPENKVSKTVESLQPKFSEIQSTIQKQNKNVPKQKCAVIKQTSSKKPPLSHVPTTSQQPAQDKSAKPNTSTQPNPQKKSTEDPVKVDVAKTVAPPLVDLIDCAYLPRERLSSPQLNRIRQNLERRQVNQWNDKIKSRRDKRQLRLLSN